VTSAAGPSFVTKCSEDRRRFFLDANSEWSDLEALIRECVALQGDPSAFESGGLGDGNAYGLSKACANTYTLQLARRFPNLSINACTPGFIETDMTRGYAESQGKAPAELGMKTPDDGARSALHLLFGELDGNGRYYGSDCKRSPLDRYREPGSPPYTGD
jgi:NAD(P)-dependent dehydrogenase (short-subunit alcohol dehydrogenase family)